VTSIEICASGAGVFTLGRGDDRLSAAEDRGFPLPLAQQRSDDFLDDLLAARVRQRAFETIAGVNAQFAIIRENKQDRAIVLVRLAGFPCLEDLLRVIHHLGVLRHRLEDGDEQLRRRFPLISLQSSIERLEPGASQPLGFIVYVMGRRTRWKRRRCDC
jgi:hypothetical protein